MQKIQIWCVKHIFHYQAYIQRAEIVIDNPTILDKIKSWRLIVCVKRQA